MRELGTEDPYEILGVRRGTGDRTIAAAYRRLAREFHPDIAGEAATSQMMLINSAFDAIRTAERRAEYDETAPRHPTTSHHPAYNGMDRGAPRWSSERDGTGGAGPAPGRPSGSVLDFGRHIGWSIGEIARVDPGYLVWLSDRREGRRYLVEIDAALRRVGFRDDTPSTDGWRA